MWDSERRRNSPGKRDPERLGQMRTSYLKCHSIMPVLQRELRHIRGILIPFRRAARRRRRFSHEAARLLPSAVVRKVGILMKPIEEVKIRWKLRGSFRVRVLEVLRAFEIDRKSSAMCPEGLLSFVVRANV